MWGRKHIQRLWTILTAKSATERGAAATEYAVILMAFAITVVAALSYLGASTGGSFSEVVINAPLSMAACKLGGWETMEFPNGDPFTNQGDCVSFQNNGK